MPNPRPRKTSRRVGHRRKFQPGFYLTKEAEKALGEIPSGKKSEFINQAIVQYAKQRKEEK